MSLYCTTSAFNVAGLCCLCDFHAIEYSDVVFASMDELRRYITKDITVKLAILCEQFSFFSILKESETKLEMHTLELGSFLHRDYLQTHQLYRTLAVAFC